jgi:sugar lactone lactonase YvrE
VRFRGVLLFLVGFFSALASSAVAAPAGQVVPGNHQAAPRVSASPLGIPFPTSRDPQQWQAWHQRVRAQLEARRNTRAHANSASGNGSGGIIETIAGAVPFQKPVNGLKTGFGQIQGIAEDGNGNLYVAGCDLGVVLKVDSSSNTTVYAGQPLATGPAISSGDGGPATAARLPCPAGLVFDTSGNLYVSDLQDGTVRVVNSQTGIIQTVAGTPGQRDHTGDGGPATAATLEFPTGLALDGTGNLFIEDLEYVREVNLSTGIIQTIAGSAANPCAFSVTHPCPATQVSLDMFGSTIAVAQNHLYAALSSVYVGNGPNLSGAIVDVDLSTGSMQLVAGGGISAGTSSSYPAVGTIYNAEGLTADANGNVYFTELSNLVYELSAADHTAKVIAGTSAIGYSGDGGPAATAALSSPQAICFSAGAKVDFVDGLRVRSFTPGGDIAAVAGDGFANYFGDGGPSTQAGLDYPTGVVSDGSGNLYIADYWNGLIRRVDAVTGIISTVAGGGAPGVVGDGGPAVKAYLFPSALALDQANHLYVHDADTASIRVVDLESGVISTLAGNFPGQGPIVFDGKMTLYVTNKFRPSDAYNGEVWAVDVTTGASTKIAGGGATSNAPNGDGGPATDASLEDVQGLALDGQGNLYVADNWSNDVRSINLATGIISTIAGSHSDSYPTSGYSGDGGPALDAYFHGPTGLALDGAGHLVVIDAGNGVLRQIDLTTKIIATIAGNHGLPPGFSGDGSAATGATFYYPFGTTFDPSGNLWIADSFNNRVRRVVLHPTKLNATLTYGGASSGGVTFTATYDGLSFGIAPTGTVTFLNGSASLGTGTIAAATDGSGNYVATLAATSAPINAATITAQYRGDANYAAVTATAAFQPAIPSYTVSAKPASLTIKQGSAGSITFTVTPQNGFNQAVSFQCDNATLPKGVTCSFSPAAVTPNGTAAVTSTLTVQTTGAATAILDKRTTHASGWLRGGAVLALLLFGIPGGRRRFWLGGTALLLFAFCVAGVIGCGGGGSGNTGGGTQAANATPPGAYSIQVTTSVSSSVNASPVTVSLTVTQLTSDQAPFVISERLANGPEKYLSCRWHRNR